MWRVLSLDPDCALSSAPLHMSQMLYLSYVVCRQNFKAEGITCQCLRKDSNALLAVTGYFSI